MTLHEIKLQPWGRIEGTLHAGDKPAVNQVVTLEHVARDSRRSLLSWYYSRASTDDQGQFVFDRVPPGKSSIGRETGMDSPSLRLATVDVEPGEMVKVTLGGND